MGETANAQSVEPPKSTTPEWWLEELKNRVRPHEKWFSDSVLFNPWEFTDDGFYLRFLRLPLAVCMARLRPSSKLLFAHIFTFSFPRNKKPKNWYFGDRQIGRAFV